MAITSTIISSIKTAALAEFDTMTHIGFGTDNTPASPSDTALGAEVARKAFDETPVKDELNGTYDFATTLGLSEGNGNTLEEIGLFDAASGGNMALRELLNNSVPKTSSIELSVGIQVQVEVTNN